MVTQVLRRCCTAILNRSTSIYISVTQRNTSSVKMFSTPIIRIYICDWHGVNESNTICAMVNTSYSVIESHHNRIYKSADFYPIPNAPSLAIISPHHRNKWLNGRTSQIARFMGPTWGPPGSCRPQMGHMLAPGILLLGMTYGSMNEVKPIPGTWGFNLHE